MAVIFGKLPIYVLFLTSLRTTRGHAQMEPAHVDGYIMQLQRHCILDWVLIRRERECAGHGGGMEVGKLKASQETLQRNSRPDTHTHATYLVHMDPNSRYTGIMVLSYFGCVGINLRPEAGSLLRIQQTKGGAILSLGLP